MSPDQNSSPADPLPPEKSRRRHFPGLVGWIVLLGVLAMLVAVALPFFGQKTVKGTQTMALARAKQISTALKIFATDNDGNFPRAGLPEMLGAEVKDSNAAYAVLFPECLTDESIFGNAQSVYQTRPPDNMYDPTYTGKPVKTLEPGENVYSYVAGLTDKSDPSAPLVADGTDGTGHYTADAKKRGGVWSGQKAIVMRVDTSGAIETLAGPDNARYVPRHEANSPADKGNLLDVSGLGPDVRLLDPAVGSR